METLQDTFYNKVSAYYAGGLYEASPAFKRLCPCCGKELLYDYRVLQQDFYETRYKCGYYCDCGYDERYEATYTVYPTVTTGAGWQVCPHCEGSGKDKNILMNNCPVCDGKRIIGIADGKPPER